MASRTLENLILWNNPGHFDGVYQSVSVDHVEGGVEFIMYDTFSRSLCPILCP